MLAKAREAFKQQFYDATDETLPEPERLRQAEAARSLYYSRLSQRVQITARQAVAAAQAAQEAAENLAIAVDDGGDLPLCGELAAGGSS